MKNIMYLLIVFLFTFCSNKESELPRLTPQKADDIISVNSKNMLNSGGVLFSVNFVGDTTKTDFFWRKVKHLIVTLPSDSVLSKPDFEVIIDTSYDFHEKDFTYRMIKFPMNSVATTDKSKSYEEKFPEVSRYFDQLEQIKRDFVHARPVLIRNNGNSTVMFGEWAMIQEALDIDGKWKPIEFFNKVTSDLVDGTTEYYSIHPKRFIGASVIKYHGNFKTKIRVKFRTSEQNFYSNTILGYINRSQFNQHYVATYLDIHNPNYSEGDTDFFKYVFLDLW